MSARTATVRSAAARPAAVRHAAVALLAAAALAGCSQSGTTSASPASETSAAPAATSSEPEGTSPATGTTTADDSGEIDTSKGAALTCGQWRAASREQRLEATKVYLESKNQPAGDTDATLASVDIDVYCAGNQHTDEPIEPGFQTN